jgi:hypothetical protein
MDGQECWVKKICFDVVTVPISQGK